MAYDEYLADRVRQNLSERRVDFRELKMMGGLCIMVDEKMCVGIMKSKESGEDLIMARVGEDAYEKALEKKGCKPMTFTGKSMKGMVYVDADGFDFEEDLDEWIQLCLDYNPFAKASKKRKKKSV